MRKATVFLGALCARLLLPSGAGALNVVSLDSKAPMVNIKVMVKAGSAQDPEGLEGLAALTAALLVEGGFGDPAQPVTKERLAELTRPWGSAAYPSVSVSKEVTVVSFTVPREFALRYVDEVLGPLLSKPLFDAKELERLRGESLQALRSGLRLEQIEELGLVALDNYIHDGTAYAHPDGGTEKGLAAVTREAALRFYRTHYQPGSVVVGLGAGDAALKTKLEAALAGVGRGSAAPYPGRQVAAPAPVKGREAALVALPNAISSGLHAGFPLKLTRAHKDFWPLYVANVWFGTHRDGFSHLYQVIREERGYNYGDYSYIEHFEGRPSNLFPPFNTPRRYQYFSLWARPVGHAYVPHLLRALAWELDHFVRTGLPEDQCALAKNKAKVLYLSLAETADRILAAKLDDSFYGMKPGYLEAYLKNIEAVTCARVNAAIKEHLSAADIKFLVVTNVKEAAKIAEAAASPEPAWGKEPSEYQIDVKEEDGRKLFLVPELKLDILRRDAVWAYAPLGLTRENIRIVPVERVFETAAFPR